MKHDSRRRAGTGVALPSGLAVPLWNHDVEAQIQLIEAETSHGLFRGSDVNNSTNMAQDFSSYSRRIKGSILKLLSFDATQKRS
jgi:hypothetical protein